jgi:hypothetical protein
MEEGGHLVRRLPGIKGKVRKHTANSRRFKYTSALAFEMDRHGDESIEIHGRDDCTGHMEEWTCHSQLLLNSGSSQTETNRPRDGPTGLITVGYPAHLFHAKTHGLLLEGIFSKGTAFGGSFAVLCQIMQAGRLGVENMKFNIILRK